MPDKRKTIAELRSQRWFSAPGLIGAHPSLIAGVIYRDFTRVRDDATVVVVRASPS